MILRRLLSPAACFGLSFIVTVMHSTGQARSQAWQPVQNGSSLSKSQMQDREGAVAVRDLAVHGRVLDRDGLAEHRARRHAEALEDADHLGHTPSPATAIIRSGLRGFDAHRLVDHDDERDGAGARGQRQPEVYARQIIDEHQRR